MTPFNKEVLEQLYRVLYFKISNCYEYLNKIEDNEKYKQAFSYLLPGKEVLSEEEMARYEFIIYSEEEFLKILKYIIKDYEEFKTILEDKIKQLEKEEQNDR